jgi:hypothetical protein
VGECDGGCDAEGELTSAGRDIGAFFGTTVFIDATEDEAVGVAVRELSQGGCEDTKMSGDAGFRCDPDSPLADSAVSKLGRNDR